MRYKHAGAFFIIAAFVAGAFGFVGAQNTEMGSTPSRKIVVFKEGTTDTDVLRMLSSVKGQLEKKMRHAEMSVALLDKAGAAKLAKHPGVVLVEDDVAVEALETDAKARSSAKAFAPPPQTLPWGIDRIDAELVWPKGEAGAGIDVGVIDTGVSTAHSDLKVKGGVSEVWYTASYNDDNGHGSHVAGIIAATNNAVGVVGAAHSANLYAIKVLDRTGSGYLSDVIDGIDWAVANGMEVINMSLGCDCPSQVLHDAVIRANNAGVVTVAAAGNSGGAVSYPAAYPEVISVSATDVANSVPYWSSRGPEVDLAAPGVSIYSTYKGNKYATMSGTSMASPHVAGAAVLVLKSALDTAFDELGNCIAEYDADCSGVWSPAEIQHKLEASAVDLGAPGQDDLYGYGLVNANAAFSL